jgi:hypothetical protein
MFSYFGNRSKDMAFAPYKHELARAAAAVYAADTLAAYLQGRERRYAVTDAINELRALFGAGANWPIALIERGLTCEDEEKRAGFFDEAMQLIARQVRGQ